MVEQEIYLDNNGTTRPLPEVCQAVMEAMGPSFGNPSSDHAAGNRARRIVAQARHHVAALLGGRSDQIVFTSSGTEANNLVILSAAVPPARIVSTRVEHSSVLRTLEVLQQRGVEVVFVPVDGTGCVELDSLEKALRKETSLVSIQWVNNETGTIQPIDEIAELCGRSGIPLHTDAAQAFGKVPVRVQELSIDYATVTAHKIHGPQGVGAVYARNPARLSPMLFGGPQEAGLRAGTENVPGIAGFGKAAECRSANQPAAQAALAALRDQFEQRVCQLVPGISINGDPSRRVCNTTNLCFHGLDGQALVARLDLQGVRCSQSSACTSQRPEPSYVLRAMGLSEEDAYASIRFSFGLFNTEEEIDIAVATIRDLCTELRGFAARLHNPYHSARA
ncbi:MAG: cysteine desulfurase family protein [Thermoguttaceae bacterium]|jgi:cysteine desulfurase